MALKITIPFPLFLPPNQNPTHHRRATEVHFSRWNNANAQKFILRERAQKEIEDEIRLHKRFESALKIANVQDNATPSAATAVDADAPLFKSIGTPSYPSRPSIPGKASKYSKPPRPKISHPAFRRIARFQKLPDAPAKTESTETGVNIGEKGVSYVIPGAPFEFQYSYTETPKVKPLKLREPPYAPFGPGTMPRPWTGRAPLPPSKKKLKEFDSFELPPPNKKGVKPVQAPGPFLPGSGPKYVKSREELLGEPLTSEEIKELIRGSMKSKRQLNMGRDGLTHNMLDNIHAHWKRRRVCKIKCKGVCTVDMDKVRQQLEEKTGGKIIYSRGGVIYLFRGRNYNYRTRPRFPLMLWKPVTPVYPRLIQRAPEGLTPEEATEMRKKGCKLIPICKLGKNGVYSNLVKTVREAFEECELVRINCQGMNSSDYHKIGAKLKDLVPCVLISFEHEHILVWRGKNWKSSFPTLEDGHKEATESEISAATSIAPSSEGEEASASFDPDISVKDVSLDVVITSVFPKGAENVIIEESEDLSPEGNDKPFSDTNVVTTMKSTSRNESTSDETASDDNESEVLPEISGNKTIMASTGSADDNSAAISVGSDTTHEIVGSTENHSNHLLAGPGTHGELHDTSDASQDPSKPTTLSLPCTEGVVALWKQALETGSAVILDTASLDADMVYERAVVLARSAPPGPVFMHQPRKVTIQKRKKQETEDLDMEEVVKVPEKKESDRKSSTNQGMKESDSKSPRNKRTKDFTEDYLDVVPQGTLRIDELAKLLA